MMNGISMSLILNVQCDLFYIMKTLCENLDEIYNSLQIYYIFYTIVTAFASLVFVSNATTVLVALKLGTAMTQTSLNFS